MGFIWEFVAIIWPYRHSRHLFLPSTTLRISSQSTNCYRDDSSSSRSAMPASGRCVNYTVFTLTKTATVDLRISLRRPRPCEWLMLVNISNRKQSSSDQTLRKDYRLKFHTSHTSQGSIAPVDSGSPRLLQASSTAAGYSSTNKGANSSGRSRGSSKLDDVQDYFFQSCFGNV